ncbi:thioredoxin family protein [Actinomycetospora sp. NBRC 106375]|uniref:TlpA family protein disulfide reductase n=1 Tax=Actinomycetospora sp. NBRC 106375 TaxID=3032207 RepID=UPI0025553FA8|nr:thioredoxin family protein [Actinomycetospora sp. NBRC 106375]
MSVIGAVVLVVVLAVATVIGFVLRRRNGTIRSAATEERHGWDLAGTAPGPDDRVLLLQLSSPICTPCERTREQLGALAAEHAGVRHVDVDIAERPEVARALSVMRTPTTVAFDRTGTELLRVGGVPRRDELIAALPLEETA